MHDHTSGTHQPASAPGLAARAVVDTMLDDARYVEDHPELSHHELAASLRRIAAAVAVEYEVPDLDQLQMPDE